MSIKRSLYAALVAVVVAAVPAHAQIEALTTNGNLYFAGTTPRVYIDSQDGGRYLVLQLSSTQESFRLPGGGVVINTGSSLERALVLRSEFPHFGGWLMEFQQPGSGPQNPMSVIDSAGHFGVNYRWAATSSAHGKIPGAIGLDVTNTAQNGGSDPTNPLRGIMSSQHYTGPEGPRAFFSKSRGSGTGHEAAQAGDWLGELFWQGYDGSAYQLAASLTVQADTVTSGLVSGTMSFATADSTGVLTPVVTIDAQQRVSILHLPTTDPGVAGMLWSDGGILKVSGGNDG